MLDDAERAHIERDPRRASRTIGAGPDENTGEQRDTGGNEDREDRDDFGNIGANAGGENQNDRHQDRADDDLVQQHLVFGVGAAREPFAQSIHQSSGRRVHAFGLSRLRADTDQARFRRCGDTRDRNRSALIGRPR